MDGVAVRRQLRRATAATLATLDSSSGHPFASLVEIATLVDARPVLLLSGLARHTRNLKADPRASLLLDQRSAGGSALAAERVTLVGTLAPAGGAAERLRYLARYPSAERIADFGDFGFWTMHVAEAYVIAGFGRIGPVAGADVVLSTSAVDKLGAQAADLVDKVNEILRACGCPEHVAGLDPEGVDLVDPRRGARRLDLAYEILKNGAKAICCAISSEPAEPSPQR